MISFHPATVHQILEAPDELGGVHTEAPPPGRSQDWNTPLFEQSSEQPSEMTVFQMLQVLINTKQKHKMKSLKLLCSLKATYVLPEDW